MTATSTASARPRLGRSGWTLGVALSLAEVVPAEPPVEPYVVG